MRGLLWLVGGLAVGAAIIVLLWFRADLDDAKRALAGRAAVIATEFGEVEYAVAGEGTAALVIHGTGGGFDQGLAMTSGLRPYGYRVIAPSRFGYLESVASGPVTLEMQADAFVPLLDALQEERVVVLGGSAGALTAMQFVIRHPERCAALVLMVPAAYAPSRRSNASAFEGPAAQELLRAFLGSDFLFWLMRRVTPGLMARMMLATDPAVVAAASPVEQARFESVMRSILPVSSRREGILFDMATAGDPPQMDLSAIHCPVLAISVRDDLFETSAPAQYIADSVPDGRAVIYDTGGHLWIGHEAAFWQEVAAFLEAAPAEDHPQTLAD